MFITDLASSFPVAKLRSGVISLCAVFTEDSVQLNRTIWIEKEFQNRSKF